MKYYTGIGSRNTPSDILKIMTLLAIELEKTGWCLRSGGARGADSAFHKSITNHDIFLPFKGFCNKGHLVTDKNKVQKAMYFLQTHNLHENWNALINNPSQMKNLQFHTRNVFQVLGEDLNNPSKMLVCWTPDGAKETKDTSYITGGTRTAIRLANVYGVPVYNLKNEDDLKKITDFLTQRNVYF